MAAAVTLHVYDVGTAPVVAELNHALCALGTGAFHGAIEVYGREWSFGYCQDGTGVFCCEPKGCTAHHYRESLSIGETKMTPAQAGTLLVRLQEEWPGNQYDLLRHNCVIFSDTFSRELGTGPIPTWVLNLGGAGATLQDGFNKIATPAQNAAIIAAAKAGQINDQYKIADKTSNAASIAATQAAILSSQASDKYKELDSQYKIKDRVSNAASQTAAASTILAMQAATKASELDAQYKLKEQATGFLSGAAARASALNEQYRFKDTAAGLAAAASAKGADALAQASTTAAAAASAASAASTASAPAAATNGNAAGASKPADVKLDDPAKGSKCDLCVVQ